jgi:nanoRNase/pAp phosphatase (c-di-AMP/oligoRNAs hydrolase)
MPGFSAPLPSDATRQHLEQLDEWFAARPRRGRWLILSHDNPDPDALASASLLRTLLRRRYGAKVTLGYGGIIGRPENRQMVRALHMRLSHLRHLSWGNYRYFALVDTQPGTGNNQLPADRTPTVVIDHHPLRRTTASSVLPDVRPAWGATASLVADYLLAAGSDIERAAATGLVYAIRTETQDFSREASGPDRQLYDWLYPRADKRVLGRIQHPKLPPSYFHTLAHALDRTQAVGNVLVCHLPSAPTPDNVPQIAVLLLRPEGKPWCLATGPHGGRLYLALRTTNPRADAGRAMRRILGRKGKGGGHGTMAGGWYPLDGAESPRAIQEVLAARLLRLLRKEPERLMPARLAGSEPIEDG